MPSSTGGDGRQPRAVFRRRRGHGEVHGERRALPRRALDADVAAALFDDPVHGSQPQAGAAADRLGGEERLEQPGLHLLRHPAAGIRDRELDVRTRWQRAAGGTGAVAGHLRGGNRDAAAVGHGVAGVGHQVQQHLLDLRRVRADRLRRRGELEVELDAFLDEAAQDLCEASHRVVEVVEPRRHDLAPAERQQLLGQRGGAHRGAADGVERLRHLAPRRLLHGRDLALAQDDGEQVVEVVGDAPGEIADRLHLLRLPDLLFEPLLRGDVERDPGRAHGHPALVAHGAADASHPARRAVRPARPVLDAQIGRVVGARHQLPHGRLIVGVHQLRRRRRTFRRTSPVRARAAAP